MLEVSSHAVVACPVGTNSAMTLWAALETTLDHAKHIMDVGNLPAAPGLHFAGIVCHAPNMTLDDPGFKPAGQVRF